MFNFLVKFQTKSFINININNNNNNEILIFKYVEFDKVIVT